MTMLDALLLDLTADLTLRPLAPGILAARADIRAAVADLATIPDAALDDPWNWSGTGMSETRFAFYRAYETLELAAADAEAAVADGPSRPSAVRLIAPATAARWDLHGLLHGISDADWDTDPGDGEWTIRRTIAHIIGSQHSFAWGTAWWLRQALWADDPSLPRRVPAEFLAALPNEDTEDLAGIRTEAAARLDALLDLSFERLAGLPDDMLALGARYGGVPVSVGFRMGRWSSHIREHTIQVEKTLAMLDRRPTEVDRLVRLVLGAYGRLEAVVLGLPTQAGGATATAIATRAAGEARRIASSAAVSAP
ncbi:MAG: DinB family protein [Chloroflexi bacterium]|nr:DinB family protein [Chloroflexota bacterium]